MDEQAHTDQGADEHADTSNQVSEGFAGVRVAKVRSQQGEDPERLTDIGVVMVVCTVGGDRCVCVAVHRGLQSVRTPMRLAGDPSLPAPGGANQFFSRKHPDGQGCRTASREASRCHSRTTDQPKPRGCCRTSSGENF